MATPNLGAILSVSVIGTRSWNEIMDWANVLENALPVFTICGVFFLWLRQDNKRLEDKIDGEFTQLRQ